MGSNSAAPLTSVCGYWQSQHLGRTSGGYTGIANARFDARIVYDSPLDAFAMERPDYLRDPERISLGLLSDARFLDYVWLSMTVNQFDFLVLHPPEQFFAGKDLHVDRLKALLRHAQVFADAAATVYDRARLEPPAEPILVRTDGWRGDGWPGPVRFVAERNARMAIYTPASERPLMLVVEAATLFRPRWVRLVEVDRELARWKIVPGETKLYASPAFRLSAGLHQLTLVSDGDERPYGREPAVPEGDRRPYSLHVAHLSVRTAPDVQKPADMVARSDRAREQSPH
jgi:hypothetical protein